MSAMSPSSVVRCALFLCSLAILIETWPSVPVLVRTFKQGSADAKANQPFGADRLDATQAPQDTTILWLRVSLGLVVSVIAIAAILAVPRSDHALEVTTREAKREADEARRALQQSEERTKEAEEQLAQVATEKAEAQRMREYARQAKAEADKARDLASNREMQYNSKLAEFEEENRSLAEQKRQVNDALNTAATAKAEAQTEAAKIKQAAEITRAEAIRLSEEEKAKSKLLSDREAKCVERERVFSEERREFELKKASLSRRGEEIEKLAQRAANDRQEAETKHNAATTERIAAEEALSRVQSTQDMLEQLRKSLWPPWIINGAVSPSLGEIEESAATGNPNAAIVLSYLQVLQAVERHPAVSREFNYLWSTVRELGRFLALLLADQGKGADESADRMLDWAKALNQAARGCFTISVPTLQSRFDPKQMESTSPIDRVNRVVNWSVSNARSIVASKAEVE